MEDRQYKQAARMVADFILRKQDKRKFGRDEAFAILQQSFDKAVRFVRYELPKQCVTFSEIGSAIRLADRLEHETVLRERVRKEALHILQENAID